MASTSTQMVSGSCTSNPRWTHNVFLSFRGEDTRYNFTDHLYSALVRRGINAFRDDKLRRGEEIEPELLKTIEESRSSIVVFSKTYADSRWCLEEIAKIMECRQRYEQIVLPIFYHVNPSDVRKQTGSFGEAFTRYEENWKNKVQRWREALAEAGNISGWHIEKGYESEDIKKITEDIFRRLNHGFMHVDKNLVGLDSHLKEMTSKLCIESNDVRMVGIYGGGGIGKTTLAKVVYNRIFHQYEGCTIFLESVREACIDHHGLLNLQKQLLDALVGESHYISNVDQGKLMIKSTLRFRRVLIILDDIDDPSQLESLVGSKEWFGPGSRIIITTRNKHLLKLHHPNGSYQMKELDVEDAIELFSWSAFRQNHPKQEYAYLSEFIVDYAKGLPLALKILGSLLCGRTILEWESELHKLKRIPNMEILRVLRISFDGLDREQKDIFLDIACFFKGQDIDFVSTLLDGYSGIGHLSDRSLISILNNKIHMHDLIQQMGWEIVREKYPKDPNKWSRLWEPEDIYRAFTRKQGMENVEAIFMDLSRIKEIQFSPQAWAEMMKLRLLQIVCSDDKEFMKKESKVHFPEDFVFPSYELSYLFWERYPLKSLPSNFEGENLVEINLRNSNIRQLWQGKKCLGKLKVLDLEGSEQLIEIPNFSNISNLEQLNLCYCTSLDKIDSSIGKLKNLNVLELAGCEKLRSLPSSMQHLDSLETLNLFGCSNLGEFPTIRWSCRKGLKVILLSGTPIKKLPFSIYDLPLVQTLVMGNRKNLRSLPSSICSLKSLQKLSLPHCLNLETFPEITEDVENFEHLALSETAIKELPSTIQHLKPHKSLTVGGCSRLEKFLKNQESLKDSLTLLDLRNRNLMEGAILNDVWCLSLLKNLYLGGNNFRHIPAEITLLCNLRHLEISHCKMLEGIPELPLSLRDIDAHDCTSLETLSSPSSLLWSSFLQWFKSAKFQDLEDSVDDPGIPTSTGIVIPGSSGIPGWVDHQEMEREVRVKLPMNWYEDNRFLGFGLFCLFQNDGTSVDLTCDLELHDDDSYEVVNLLEVRFSFGCGDCKLGDVSDDLWVTYCPKISIPEKYHSNQFKHIRASFSVVDGFYDQTINSAIKSCGIHLIYSQDHEQKNTLSLDSLGTQDDDLPDNFQDNIESIAEDTNNGNVKRSRDDAEQNQAEEPPHKRSRTFFSIFNSFTQAVMKNFRF